MKPLKTVEGVKNHFESMPLPKGVELVKVEFMMAWNGVPAYVALYRDTNWDDYRLVSASEGRKDSRVTTIYDEEDRALRGFGWSVNETKGTFK